MQCILFKKKPRADKIIKLYLFIFIKRIYSLRVFIYYIYVPMYCLSYAFFVY